MRLPRQIYDAIIAHARFEYPNEACGLLAADTDGNLRMAYCLTNRDSSPTTYTVDPTEHFRALRHAERSGWELAGVFHSHTHSAAYPSPTDVRQAMEPDWIYVIAGLRDLHDPDVRGYWIRNGKVSEEALVTTD